MSTRTRSLIFLVLASLCWSTSGALLKGMPSVHWLAISGFRALFASLIFLPGLVAKPRPRASTLAACIVIYTILVTALMGSMQLGTAAQGIWLQYIAPAVVALYAWLFQRQRIARTEWLAIVLVLIAVGLIVLGGSGRAHQQSVVLGLISGVGFGAFVLMLKSAQEARPAAIFLWTNLGTAALLIPLAIVLGVNLPGQPREWMLLCAMGWFQLGLGYYLFQHGLAHTRAVEASLIGLIEPVLNPIWVYLIFRELPPLAVIAGCGLMSVAVLAMTLAPGRWREPPH